MQRVVLLRHRLGVPLEDRAHPRRGTLLDRIEVDEARSQLDVIAVRRGPPHPGLRPCLRQLAPFLWQPVTPAPSVLEREGEVEHVGSAGEEVLISTVAAPPRSQRSRTRRRCRSSGVCAADRARGWPAHGAAPRGRRAPLGHGRTSACRAIRRSRPRRDQPLSRGSRMRPVPHPRSSAGSP